jgi:Ca-activated chloride channel family protein
MRNKHLFKYTVLLASLLLLGSLSSNVFADGFIIPTPRDREKIPPLSVKYRRISVDIINQVAETSVDQVFLNPYAKDIEGTFYFPLPEEAAISEFVMYMGDKKVQGEVLEKDQARRIYESIVRELKDPAILEYVGRNMFRAKVFPIPANGETRVTLSYSEVLKAEGNLVKYIYPLNTEKLTPHRVEQVSVSMKINSQIALSSIYSPSHKVSVRQQSEREAQVSFERIHVKPDKDFHLYYSLTRDDVGLSFMNYEGADGNYFMLLASPQYFSQQEKIIDKNLIFVLDSSGSMSGRKIVQAKDAVRFIINHLSGEDRFALIDFDDGVTVFSTELVSATSENRKNALQFVDQIEDAGGTNINDALHQALRMVQPDERPTYILFLTDGQPTVGIRRTKNILKNIKGANEAHSRIFVFGVGDDVNADLLDKISKENRGVSIYVDKRENIEVAISSYYTKISSPILSDVRIDFEDIQVNDSYPRVLPDLFKGSQLVLVGKYLGKGPAKVILSGKIGKKEKKFVLKNQKLTEEESFQFLPRLWSTRRVGYLLGEIRFHGEEPELVDEIKDLGIRFGIVTPYTSFLIKEEEKLARNEITFSDSFEADIPVRGREYQQVLKKSIPITELPAERYKVSPNVKGSRDRDFKATVSGISNVDPLTGRIVSDVDPDAVEEIEIISGGSGEEFSKKHGGFADIRISKAVQQIKEKEQPFRSASEKIKYKDDKTFYLKDEYWVDSEYEEDSSVKEIKFNSDEYYQLIKEKPEIAKYLSVAQKLIICFEGITYKITAPEQS